MDYREILRRRSMGCSQRQMERDKLVSREKSKAIFAAADRVVEWYHLSRVGKLTKL